MKTILFAGRNAKEILRDPMNLFFGLGFPLVLLLLLSLINKSISSQGGTDLFAIDNLVPGLLMFGTAFMALFSGMLLAKDKGSFFLMRLFVSPMTALDFLLGYTLPILLIAFGQVLISTLAALAFGFELDINALPAILVATLTSLLFIAIGLLFGSLLNEKAVSGICGALVTNLAGWLSGIFIPLDLVGGVFKKTAQVLPFYNSVEAIKHIFEGDFSDSLPHLGIVAAYTLVIYLLAIFVFNREMQGK